MKSTTQATRTELEMPSQMDTSIEKQRACLVEIAQSFHSICGDAVRGNYEHIFFQGCEVERRLCSDIMNKHYAFAKALRDNGSTWKLVEVAREGQPSNYRTRQQAIIDAAALQKRSRGQELPGTPNPALVGELFRSYSKPWAGYARFHIKNVWEATNLFIDLLLEHLTDNETREKIQRHWIIPRMEERLKNAYEKLDDLLAVHNDQPLTTNPQFLQSTARFQGRDTQTSLVAMIKAGRFKDADDAEVSRLLSGIGHVEDMDRDLVAAEAACDSARAFYEVAINLFADNVPTLAIQSPIVRGLPSIFSPTAVLAMDDATIRVIAGELEQTDQSTFEGDKLASETAPVVDPAHASGEDVQHQQKYPSSREESNDAQNATSLLNRLSELSPPSEHVKATSCETKPTITSTSDNLAGSLHAPDAPDTVQSSETVSEAGIDTPRTPSPLKSSLPWSPLHNTATLTPSLPDVLFGQPTKLISPIANVKIPPPKIKGAGFAAYAHGTKNGFRSSLAASGTTERSIFGADATPLFGINNSDASLQSIFKFCSTRNESTRDARTTSGLGPLPVIFVRTKRDIPTSNF